MTRAHLIRGIQNRNYTQSPCIGSKKPTKKREIKIIKNVTKNRKSKNHAICVESTRAKFSPNSTQKNGRNFFSDHPLKNQKPTFLSLSLFLFKDQGNGSIKDRPFD
jgi:hypothetical protein